MRYLNANHFALTGAKKMSAEAIKQNFQQRGITFADWAAEHGYTRQEVYRVLNGQAKAKYGKAHEIAVKLGMKSSAS
jgi:gp16 family phage-associated protein